METVAEEAARVNGPAEADYHQPILRYLLHRLPVCPAHSAGGGL